MTAAHWEPSRRYLSLWRHHREQASIYRRRGLVSIAAHHDAKAEEFRLKVKEVMVHTGGELVLRA